MMERFIIDIDDMDDAALAVFGWLRIDENEEFALFWNAEYRAHQPVSLRAPRFLMLDDWSDVAAMGRPVVQTLRSLP